MRAKQEELREREAEHFRVLEEISGLTREEAERRLFADLESELEDRLGPHGARAGPWRPRRGRTPKRAV